MFYNKLKITISEAQTSTRIGLMDEPVEGWVERVSDENGFASAQEHTPATWSRKNFWGAPSFPSSPSPWGGGRKENALARAAKGKRSSWLWNASSPYGGVRKRGLIFHRLLAGNSSSICPTTTPPVSPLRPASRSHPIYAPVKLLGWMDTILLSDPIAFLLNLKVQCDLFGEFAANSKFK